MIGIKAQPAPTLDFMTLQSKVYLYLSNSIKYK